MKNSLTIAILVLLIVLIGLPKSQPTKEVESVKLHWGDLGARLVASGVIDVEKLPAGYDAWLTDQKLAPLEITAANSHQWLNLFWALGLANKNPILESGEMMDARYGGAGNFASTGGWTLARGPTMDHYSQHQFVTLTPEQQAIVDRLARGIYRPCCNNSAHFPDCNHGMAMLGLLELMAAQGASEEEMWQMALIANTYWFPDHYRTIAVYFKNQGVEWDAVKPREVLDAQYSSASGYAKIAASLASSERQEQVSCGV
ncbi:MAG: hypothetical protein AAB468_01205 [Patescibacteria group bacterium]